MLFRNVFVLWLLFIISPTVFASTYRHFDLPDNTQSSSGNSIGSSEGVNASGDSLSKEEQKAISICDYVKQYRKFVKSADSLNSLQFPIGIISDGQDLNYAIAIDRDEVTDQGSFLSAYMSFEVPQSGDTLTFAAHHIPVSADGGITGEVKIELIQTKSIFLGSSIKLSLLGNGQTYVTFGCGGFKNMKIAARLDFSPEVFVREDPETGKTEENKPLSTTFETTIDNWNNLLVGISIDPFQIKGLPGFGFELRNMVLDMSDLSNAPSFQLPAGYNPPGGLQPTWTGIFVKEAIVRLPKEFNKQNTNAAGSGKKQGSRQTRTSMSAQNLIFDGTGFSGVLEAQNLLMLNEGSMNGWPFSVERISISIVSNQLTQAGFQGQLSLPVLDSTLRYSAVIGVDGDYIFSVSTTKKCKFDLWAASVELDPGSTLTISKIDGKFKPTAVLNGILNVNVNISDSSGSSGGGSSNNLVLAQIKFQDLTLQTERPFISKGIFSLGSPAASSAMAGFPLQVKELMVTLDDDKATLGCKVSVGINSSNSNLLNVQGTIAIKAERVSDTTSVHKGRWQFASVDIGSFEIKANVSIISVEGLLVFYKNDATYGHGFYGNVSASIDLGGSSNLGISAAAMFGKDSTLHYWFIDGLISFKPGIAVFPPLGIYGFGGGAYYHMKPDGMGLKKNTIGASTSGIVYVPDSDTYIELKAIVKIGICPDNTSFNGDASLGVAFNNSGGVKSITFTGNGYFMTAPADFGDEGLTRMTANIAKKGENKEIEEDRSERAAVKASVYLSYDFSNKVLHGNSRVYVNVLGIIKGANPGNLAGDVEMHFSSNDWYVYIGKPDLPVGIIMMSVVRTSSYFMMGSTLPNSPDIPLAVKQILNIESCPNYMAEIDKLSTGKGVAFGSRLELNTGDISFLIFFANMAAGIGFDVALKNYGNTTCEGSSSRIGINGWYANGQAYAYLQGKIGVRVKIFKIEKKATILEGGAAALMQAKVPNPFWMKGEVGGYFSVLDGLAKGSYRIEFTFGEECKIAHVGNALEGVNIIGKLTPEDKSANVNVFTAPQVVFNYQINKSFELLDADNQKRTYRINPEEIRVYVGSTPFETVEEWNTEHTVVALKPRKIFPSYGKVKFVVKVSFEEYKNGRWEVVVENGQKFVEQQEINFTTGKAPDYIPIENVAYSYPIINQMNYYKNITSDGYVQLKIGQDSLFQLSNFKPIVRITDISTQKKYESNVSYNASTSTITFQRPANLPNNAILKYEIVNVPQIASDNIEKNVKNVESKVINNTQASGVEVSVRTKTAEGSIKNLKEKVILTYHFRTSKYSTLAAKLANSNRLTAFADPINSLYDVELLLAGLNVDEYFDYYEIYDHKNGLIRIQADLSNNNYYNTYFKSFYESTDLLNKFNLRNEYGRPPVNAAYIYQTITDKKLTESEVSTGKANTNYVSYSTVMYDVVYQMVQDLGYIRQQILSNYYFSMTDEMKKIAMFYGKYVTNGDYDVWLNYYLPGKTLPVYSKKISLNINY